MVRLGVMWEAVETHEGVYNLTYLEEIDKLITKLGQHGIYTLIDAHQDAIARTICGEGMPTFYAEEILKGGTHCISLITNPIAKALGFCKPMSSYNLRKDENGNPLVEDC